MIGIPDIISAVVDDMKTLTYFYVVPDSSIENVGYTCYTNQTKSLYVGAVIDLTVTEKGGTITNYVATVTSVGTKPVYFDGNWRQQIIADIPELNDQETTSGVMRLYFMHGHPLEIVNTLADKANASSYKGKRFPLIALYQDIEENVRNEGYERIAPVTVIIANQTDPNYTAATRQDQNFDPILYKLEAGFKYCLKKSEYIGGLKPDYNRIDRVFWGRNGIYGNEGNMFQDYIDAIELNNLELKIINT